MAFNRKDHFFHKAKKDGFLARSAYKLEEIQKKHRLFKRGDFVLDLGASPGSWSQYASKAVGPEGLIVGIDLKPVEFTALNAEFHQMNIFELDPAILHDRQPDVIMSDMAPNTTGIRSVDQARSEDLCLEVIKVATQFLKPGGHLVMKIFESQTDQTVTKELKSQFKEIKRLKPEAVRKGSFETYLIAKNYQE
ncbi:MAG: RlmE family RNA methyltransferase [Bdellovibrionaceae bacterium]|nr:RlmE family RNA methyltransferase [Pseudobdellovibrionaceae bacterium]